MSALVVNELSSLYLTFSFFDELGAPVIPTTVDWRVDDITDPHTPVQIRDWTVAAPGETAAVTVAGSQNNILDQSNSFETRVVTVRVDSTLGTQAYERMKYRVKNLVGAP